MSNEKREKKTLTQSFEGLTDPRNPEDIIHKLIDIVAITILAMMCGANGWNDIELFGKSKESWLSTRRNVSLPLNTGRFLDPLFSSIIRHFTRYGLRVGKGLRRLSSGVFLFRSGERKRLINRCIDK